MNPTISRILNKYRTDAEFHTHVSMGNFRGKFSLGREALENLWDEYCDCIDEPETELCLAEVPQRSTPSPILVDIDIKMKELDGIDLGENKIYSEEHIETVIEVYQSVLSLIVDNCKEENLICVLLEKPLYRVENNGNVFVKNGFHLHFPGCFLKPVEQEVHLIPRVKETFNELDIFADIGIEDSSSVVDDKACSVPWLMYGSRKDNNLQPYKVTKVFDHQGKEISLDEAFKYYTIYDKDEEVIQYINSIEYYLPRILSIIPWNRETQEIKHNIISPVKEKIRKKEIENDNYKKHSVKEAIQIIKDLLPMISDERAYDRESWLSIGYAMKNATEEDLEGLELFHQFSARCQEKYNEAECDNTWESLKPNKVSIGTIRHYAKIDSPQQYADYKKKKSLEHSSNTIEGCHYDVAKTLFINYNDEFICADTTDKNSWFQFINNRWKWIKDGTPLRKRISEDLVEKFNILQEQLRDDSNKLEDSVQQAYIATKLAQCKKIMQQLKSHQYKNCVMGEAREIFFDPNFLKELDKDPYLICFRNGVYDLKNNKFRKGKPDDYISKQMPIKYVEFNEDDERVALVDDFLTKIFPDKSLRQYFLDIVSDVFVGGNKHAKFFFWTGVGRNGKSITQKLFEAMLGDDLAIILPTTLLSGKKSMSGAPDPNLVRAKNGVRWAVFEEPDAEEEIHTGRLKYLTGGDSIEARDLFQKGQDIQRFKPMFMSTLICNTIPKLRGMDFASMTRIRVLPFETLFSKDAPNSFEEQLLNKNFPLDPDFETDTLPKLIEPFAWKLLHHRKSVICIKEPSKVLEATKLYQRQNDIFRQFIEDKIVESPTANVSLEDINNEFRTWYRDAFSNGKPNDREELKNYLTTAWGDMSKGRKWQGYRIRTIKDDQDEDDTDDESDNEESLPNI
jgi:P4 family phage/plasmid primase-like protien